MEVKAAEKERETTEVEVPKGYVPVLVGREMKDSAKFLIHIDMFKNEYFAGLLQMVAEEVGYGNTGVLRIPCDAECFRKLLNEISRVN
ncbi:Auxin responsive SAUR protein [Corchorus olitorius]|uniref:Auxin responsive SAUR protein n=1 Tax=Corchorus olitorius TaxID=93759 RepID=A0A1R3H6P9_9ROSI|nr:Auxin responsive SAUR protein [Corchorus olitorius]